MKRPPTLRPGSRVAAVRLSNGLAAEYPELYEWGHQQLKQHFDIELVPMTNTLRSTADIYANPALRVADFYEAWERPDIDAVMSVIGEDKHPTLATWIRPGSVKTTKCFWAVATPPCSIFSSIAADRQFLWTGRILWLCGFWWAHTLYGQRLSQGGDERRAHRRGSTLQWFVRVGRMNWKEPELEKLPPLRRNPPWHWINGKEQCGDASSVVASK